jgi:hypothetical protein
MKIHHLLLAAALSASVTSRAQWPTCTSFNTANNGLGGLVGVGNPDNTWRCSPVFGGPYNLIPQQVAPASGWHTGTSAPFFPCDADWISYPHTCDPNDIRQDHCNCLPHQPCIDEYYEFLFTLPTPGPYVLPLTMMADNCIVEVWLNNVTVYNAPPAQLAAGPNFYGGYLFTGFQAGNQVNLNITAPFIAGLNSLKVHVRSGINTLNTGWTGFVCFNTPCVRTGGGPGDPPDDPRDVIKPNGIDGHTSTSVLPGGNNTVVLNQNVPNPFAESTVITYVVPPDFKTAQLVFRTNQGTVIKTIDITRAGKGSVTVYADDLSSGLYTYNLVIEDRVVDSKKMVRE